MDDEKLSPMAEREQEEQLQPQDKDVPDFDNDADVPVLVLDEEDASLDQLIESVEDEIKADDALKHLRVKQEDISDEEPIVKAGGAAPSPATPSIAAEAWCKNNFC